MSLRRGGGVKRHSDDAINGAGGTKVIGQQRDMVGDEFKGKVVGREVRTIILGRRVIVIWRPG